MSDDALGCRPSVTVSASGPNPVVRSQLPVTDGAAVTGNSAVTLAASPACKSVALPSIASLLPSDSTRDVYQQRVQVSSNAIELLLLLLLNGVFK